MSFGSIFGGIASGLGSIASSAMSYKSNKRLIQMQQRWQERMSNTAHQREVADLRAAGLNPILSGTGGSGASFGSASAPSMQIENPVESGINSARANKMNKAQIDNIRTNTESQTEDIHNKIVNRRNETARTNADIENSTALTNAQIEKIYNDIGVNNYNALTGRIGVTSQIPYLSSSVRSNNATSERIERENKFNRDHPYIYGSQFVVPQLLQLFGAAAIGGAGTAKAIKSLTPRPKVGF